MVTASVVLDRVMSAGIPDDALAKRIVRATVSVLGERLTEDEARLLVRRLPDELADAVEQDGYDGDFDAAELYDRIRRRARADVGVAREGAEIVLQAIGELLEDEERTRLVRALPEPVARHLLPRDFGEPPEHVPPSHAPPLTTLAHGRPGSRHPLSEAAPPSGQTHSVAANDDPHAETKLSSSHGLTQERRNASLATGHPPEPDRPIDEAKD